MMERCTDPLPEELSIAFEYNAGGIARLFLEEDGEHFDVKLNYEGLLDFIRQHYILCSSHEREVEKLKNHIERLKKLISQLANRC